MKSLRMLKDKQKKMLVTQYQQSIATKILGMFDINKNLT